MLLEQYVSTTLKREKIMKKQSLINILTINFGSLITNELSNHSQVTLLRFS